MRKLSRIERIIRAGFEIGKYGTGAVVVLSLMGCVHLPKPVSVSEDGKYAVVAVSENGEIDFSKTPKRAAILNMTNNSIEVIPGTYDSPLWLTNSGNNIAFASESEKDRTRVVIFSDGKEQVIENASYPCFSGNGQLVIYSRIKGDEKDPLIGELFVRDIRTKKDRKLGLEGFVADFSPDSQHISFIQRDGEKNYLCVCDSDAKNARVISEIKAGEGESFPFFPYWISNKEIIFQTTKESEKDSEIFISDISGRVMQVSDNGTEEFIPQADSLRRVFYLTRNQNQGKMSLWRAEYANGKWENKRLGINPDYFTLCRDKLVYVVRNSGDNSFDVFSADIKDIPYEGLGNVKAVNLSERIKGILNKK